MKVLLVEDEPGVVSFIRRGLIEAGHEVSVAMDGVTAWQMIQMNIPDIIILDIMLPSMNGIELCRKIRSQQIQAPIIMLTALGTSENIVTGLDSGADDYMIKPFKFSELLARISAVTRRVSGHSTQGDIITIDDLLIDTRGKIVKRGEERINLTAKEYNLLEFLARNKGRVFSRAEILERVWDINFDMNTNVVDVYINYLRRKVDKQRDKKLIQTVVGIGYVLRDEYA
ncbi:response regulator transcription factor [Ohtaekwangia koreensis]|uniref:DNA-binding response regulator, OmpR family, contains REC and winged-helix (WHTH) domain n=1 Tax=Ohtaekwangia koreensis TaxID=688867 RepID=A0A1T5JAA9_9BACT|nr:response regulator transcription factor [Ohtaekwangia koreensis]SKC48329.1 DNA-binding response regulator, OmpR family, contains REC and winged-helix (wHTH) domain [Ohtaekwangia koreensis]